MNYETKIRDDIATFDLTNGMKFICDASECQSMAFGLMEIYDMKVYEKLNVKDKVCVDIGGFCGESAVYFSKQGAKKVLVFEPLYSYKFITQNALINQCNNIYPYHMGVAGTHKHAQITRTTPNQGYTVIQTAVKFLDEPASGDNIIPFWTLEDIVVELKGEKAVLKVDCEGAEYEIFGMAKPETIRYFDEIIMEVHFNMIEFAKNIRTLDLDILTEGQAHKLVVYLESLGYKSECIDNTGAHGVFYFKKV